MVLYQEDLRIIDLISHELSPEERQNLQPITLVQQIDNL